MTHLFQLGDFTLNSGNRSRFKIECDAFNDQDWAALAYLISRLVGPFDKVEGVPRGGLKLAGALQKYVRTPDDWSASSDDPIYLIVDDVLTTGGSMERFRAVTPSHYIVKGAVVFARGRVPTWIKAVCQLPPELWIGTEYEDLTQEPTP